MTAKPARIMTIAGSDSGGGAGIQADIKTIMALGGYGCSALTAITAQNTLGVQGVLPLPSAFIRLQIDSIVSDIGVDMAKTGMLASSEVMKTIAAAISEYGIPLIADPVMVAKGGAALLEKEAIATLISDIVPLSHLITPNLPEAELLTSAKITSIADQEKAGQRLLTMGARAALIKGGHGEGEEIVDILVTPSGTLHFPTERIDTRHTHGTGCTLSAAIATCLAQENDLPKAIAKAKKYLHKAITLAPKIGKGHGPLNHGVDFRD